MNSVFVKSLRTLGVVLAVLGVALTIVVASSDPKSDSQDKAKSNQVVADETAPPATLHSRLTTATPIAFGLAGLLALAAALLSAYTLKREAANTIEQVYQVADWETIEHISVRAAWWPSLMDFVARRRARRLPIDLHAWYEPLSRRVGHEGMYAGMGSVLVVVGIVFSFHGIGASSDQLQKALDQKALDSQALQHAIALSLTPLKDAFGANLVGIVLAIVLLLGGLWVRGVQREALAQLRRLVFDELEPLLDIETSHAEREAAAEQQKRHEALLLELSNHLRTANDQRVRANEFTESMDSILKGLAPSVAESLAPALRIQLEPALQSLSDALSKVAEQTQGTASKTASAVASGIAETLRASYDDALQQMREILGELNTWSIANRDALDTTTKSLTSMAQEQQVSFRLAVDAFDRLRDVLPDLQKVVERLDGIVGATHDMLQQGEAGTMRASESQRTASESLAANTQSMTSTLEQLRALPTQMHGVVDQLEGRIRGLLEDSDRQMQTRMAVMDKTVRDLANNQQAIADQTQQSMREFSQQLSESVQATLNNAGDGLGVAGAKLADNLERLVARSGENVEATATELQSVISDGVGDMQAAFGEWRQAMTAMAAAINSQAGAQDQRMTVSAQQVQLATNALRDASQTLATLPPKIQEGMTVSGRDFQARIHGSLGELNVGVDTELAKAVELLQRGLASMEATADALKRSTESIGRTQDTGRDKQFADLLRVAEQVRSTLAHVDTTMQGLAQTTDGLRKVVASKDP